MAKTYTVDENFLKTMNAIIADLRQCLQWQKNFKVEGGTFTNSPAGPSLKIPSLPKTPPQSIDPEFWAIVQDSEREEAEGDEDQKYRWYYGWQEAELKKQGYDGWQVKTGGLKGEADDDDTRAMNANEKINGTSGVMGNGVDTSNLPPKPSSASEDDPPPFELQPIPSGTPVRIRRETTKDSKTQYVIVAVGYTNGIDGKCPPPEDDDIDGGGA